MLPAWQQCFQFNGSGFDLYFAQYLIDHCISLFRVNRNIHLHISLQICRSVLSYWHTHSGRLNTQACPCTFIRTKFVIKFTYKRSPFLAYLKGKNTWKINIHPQHSSPLSNVIHDKADWGNNTVSSGSTHEHCASSLGDIATCRYNHEDPKGGHAVCFRGSPVAEMQVAIAPGFHHHP